MSSDAFVIKVLNLVDHICQLPAARRRLASNGLRSLFAIVQKGSPRARVVVMRILRKLLVTPEAPEPKAMDAAFLQSISATDVFTAAGNSDCAVIS